MSSIDVLKALLSRHLFDTQNLIDESGSVERKTKALTDGIEALEKVGHVPANMAIVDKGALKMALNVLDRAGKKEVSQALRESCVDFIDSLDKVNS